MLEEYTKLSIHNHFGGRPADLTIDRPIETQAVFDLATAFRELQTAKEAGFQLLAQTNSNHLDVAAYLLMRKMASLDSVELLPGVEINLVNWENEERVLHVIVVVDPCSNLLVFTKALEESFAANGKYVLKLEQFCEILSDRRAIICVHGLKQDDRGLAGNPQMAQELLSINRFFPFPLRITGHFTSCLFSSKSRTSFLMKRLLGSKPPPISHPSTDNSSIMLYRLLTCGPGLPLTTSSIRYWSAIVAWYARRTSLTESHTWRVSL